MEVALRWAWALLVPLLIFNGLALVVTDGGWWAFWMALVGSLAIGAFSIFSAEWRLWTKIATMIVYLPVMAILLMVTGMLTSCSVHGCH